MSRRNLAPIVSISPQSRAMSKYLLPLCPIPTQKLSIYIQKMKGWKQSVFCRKIWLTFSGLSVQQTNTPIDFQLKLET